MKRTLFVLTMAAFVVSMAPAVWAQGGSDVKAGKQQNTSPSSTGKQAPKSNPATKPAPKLPQ